MAIEDFVVEVPSNAESTCIAKLECTVRCWIEEGCLRNKSKIELSAPGISIAAAADTFFHALIQIREKLEPEGWRVLCYGASRNVWPSGMSFQMSGGLRAYKRVPGQTVGLGNLVDIFATGPDVVPATIAEQRQYIRESAGIF